MVRIWKTSVKVFNRQHLLGEHVELHILWSALTQGKKGYSHHPETLRFKNHIGQLIDRHNQQIEEMKLRGYKHHSPLPDEESFKPEVYTHNNEDLSLLLSRQI